MWIFGYLIVLYTEKFKSSICKDLLSTQGSDVQCTPQRRLPVAVWGFSIQQRGHLGQFSLNHPFIIISVFLPASIIRSFIRCVVLSSICCTFSLASHPTWKKTTSVMLKSAASWRKHRWCYLLLHPHPAICHVSYEKKSSDEQLDIGQSQFVIILFIT